jgi:hypothetical protein
VEFEQGNPIDIYDRVPPPLIIQGLIDYVEDLVGRRNQVDKEDLK